MNDHAIIAGLEVENVKRIKVARIDPKTGTVIISGMNDQGKTSILDAIDWAFRGEKLADPEPIRTGEKRASVKIELSKELNSVCTVERRWTPSGSVLEIKNAEGVPQKSPQALLDTIITKMCFDPLSFIKLRSAEQMELLRKLIGLDFTAINAARQLAYDERTARGRELESAKARLASLPYNPNLPKEQVNVSELASKLADVRNKNGVQSRKNREIQQHKELHQSLIDQIARIEMDITEMRRQIEDKLQQIANAKHGLESCNKKVADLQAEIATIETIDESPIVKGIQEANGINAGIMNNALHVKASEEVDTIKAIYDGLTAKIAEYDETKAAQIEFATFPMENLGYDEARGVLLNGVPFQQGSQARQLQAAVSIGLALNPAVRVVIIRDGSLLDSNSLAMVSEMCEANKAQLWVEIVNSKDPSAIIIEDGEVKK